MRVKTAFGEYENLSQKNDVVKSSNGVFVVSPLDKPPVDVVVLKGGDWLDNRP